MTKAKSFNVTVEGDQHDILQARKDETGITIGFQLREAIKMYVEAIKEKGAKND